MAARVDHPAERAAAHVAGVFELVLAGQDVAVAVELAWPALRRRMVRDGIEAARAWLTDDAGRFARGYLRFIRQPDHPLVRQQLLARAGLG